MSPRFLGCRAVISKSFARIAETNLKKQGILPLTFVNPSDYDGLGEEDRISIHGLTTLKPGSKVTLKVVSRDGKSREVPCAHSLTTEQVEWFKAGSALNILRPK